MFNLEAQYLENEEMWFAKLGPWRIFLDKNNKIAQRSYGVSPPNMSRTGILLSCIHGGLDFSRIPYTQGMQAFDAAPC